jgi:hypothetical protein
VGIERTKLSYLGKNDEKYNFIEVSILEYNSTLFDMHFLVKCLSQGECKIISPRGKSNFDKYLQLQTSIVNDKELKENKEQKILKRRK